MVIKGYRELVIRLQENWKLTSKMRDEAETMSCVMWYLEVRLQSPQIEFDSWHHHLKASYFLL